MGAAHGEARNARRNERGEKRQERPAPLPKRAPVGMAAREYVRRGWRVVELRPRSKAPMQPGWLDMRLGEEALAGVFLPNRNIGLLLGSASDGLVDVDCDTIEARIAAARLLPPTAMAFGRLDGRAQGRGAGLPTHYLYQVEGPLPKTRKLHWQEEGRESSPHTTTLIEVRADGCQTMVPPSIHPDGSLLGWRGNPEVAGEPATITGAELDALVTQAGCAALLALYWPPEGSRNDAALALAGWLLRNGWDVEPVARFIMATAEAAGDEEWMKRGAAAESTRLRRAAGREATGATTLETLLRGGPEVGKQVMAHIATLLGIAVSGERALEQHSGAPGAPAPLKDAAPIQRIEPQVGQLLSEVASTPIETLWRDRIYRGKLNIIDGDPGIGKTMIAIDISARVTTGRAMPGEPGWEENAVVREPGGVVYFTSEDDPADTIRPRLLAAGGDPSRFLVVPYVTERGVNLETGETEELGELLPTLADLAIIEQGIQQVEAHLVVFDPFSAYLGETNAYKDQEVRRLFYPLSRLARRTGAAILFLRHLNKMSGAPAIQRGGGSMAISGAVRSALSVGWTPDPPDPLTESGAGGAGEPRAHRGGPGGRGGRLGRICGLASAKTNLAGGPPTLLYRVVPNAEGQPVIEWLGESELSAQDLLGGGNSSAAAVARPPTKRDHARDWFERLLEGGRATRRRSSAWRRARASTSTHSSAPRGIYRRTRTGTAGLARGTGGSARPCRPRRARRPPRLPPAWKRFRQRNQRSNHVRCSAKLL